MKRITKEGIKNFIGSLAFIGGAIVMLTGISYMLRPTDTGKRDVLSGFYAEERNTLDVVSIGGSGIYRFLNNPVLWKEYGMTSYNLGTSSQQSEVHEMLVNELLKTQTPDVILVETRCYIKYSDEEEEKDIHFRRVSDHMNYSLDRIRYINNYTKDWEKRLQMYFDIVFYHGEWENFKPSDIQNADNRQKDEEKGWANVYSVKPVQRFDGYDMVDVSPIDREQEEALLSLMSYCKKRQIDVLFVATPWRMTEKRVAQNKYLEQLIAEQGGLFLDCNRYVDEIGLDYTTDFYDARHTNVYGSEKVTRFIGKYIYEHFDMDLQHTDKTIEEWDRVWQRYSDEKAAYEGSK